MAICMMAKKEIKENHWSINVLIENAKCWFCGRK